MHKKNAEEKPQRKAQRPTSQQENIPRMSPELAGYSTQGSIQAQSETLQKMGLTQRKRAFTQISQVQGNRHAQRLVSLARQSAQVSRASLGESLAQAGAGVVAGAVQAVTQPRITLSTTEVQPQGTGGNQTATVTISGAPPNTELTPTVTAVAQSGGHAHDGNRPVGTVTPNPVTTDDSGQAEFTYQSNAPGGQETIGVPVGETVLQENIDVRVPDLQELGDGVNYELVGRTDTHPDNHHGTDGTISSLEQIAQAYETYKAENNHPDWPQIGYNDMSLENGGLFDIYANWNTPHRTHRVGQNVDLRTNNLNAAQRQVLREIIENQGGNILDEGDHWHLTF